MALDSLTVKQKIALTLDSNSQSNIIPLFNYVPYTKLGYRVISEYLEINDLKAVSWIYNLEEVEFPTFDLTASESEQLLTVINLEWNSPRIQLDVLCQVNTTWHKIASYSLLNPAPYPYREFTLGSHALGDNSMIGLQIVNAGHGILQATTTGNDKVVVFADLIRNIIIEKLVDTSTKIVNNITNTAAIIINSNVNRKGITIFNNSDLDIYLDTVSTVSITSYMVRIPSNKYWEAPAPIYTGNYYAVVASGSTAIDIREFS